MPLSVPPSCASDDEAVGEGLQRPAGIGGGHGWYFACSIRSYEYGGFIQQKASLDCLGL
jgi:hypothetical protein